jgi:hypothetical protein
MLNHLRLSTKVCVCSLHRDCDRDLCVVKIETTNRPRRKTRSPSKLPVQVALVREELVTPAPGPPVHVHPTTRIHWGDQSQAARLLFTPRSRRAGRSNQPPSPTPFRAPRSIFPQVNTPIAGSSRDVQPSGPESPDSEQPENFTSAMAALSLRSNSDSDSHTASHSGSGSQPDLRLPSHPRSPPIRGRPQQKRRKGAPDVWHFFEEKERRKHCKLCQSVII